MRKANEFLFPSTFRSLETSHKKRFILRLQPETEGNETLY